jgi:hypothetical protein
MFGRIVLLMFRKEEAQRCEHRASRPLERGRWRGGHAGGNAAAPANNAASNLIVPTPQDERKTYAESCGYSIGEKVAKSGMTSWHKDLRQLD